MVYLSNKEDRYVTKTGEKISSGYDIFIAGSKKQRKQIKKQLERLSKDPNLESLLEILQEIISQQQGSLDDLITQENINIPYYGWSHHPRRIFSSDKELESYLSTNENVIEIDNLGSGSSWRILGAYDPNTDTIYVLKNLNAREKAYVLAHERVHRRRHFSGESQDEYLVDQEASSRVGYDPFNRYRRAA